MQRSAQDVTRNTRE